MGLVVKEIALLKGRLDDHVTSIDDIVLLLGYCDILKSQDTKVEEIADYIVVMQTQMEFIDSCLVMLPVEMKIEFLHMRNWSRTFDSWILQRKQRLLKQKQQLIEEMQIKQEVVR